MKVLLLSQRRIADLVAYCLAYEFEDTLAAITDAERIDVTNRPQLEFSRRCYKAARRVLRSPEAARRLAPYPQNKVLLEREYDLFFPMFSNAYELYSLAMIPNWRQRCRKAACFITEVGTETVPDYLVELLSEFDHIFLGFRHGVEDIARITGRPCSYLPFAADVLRFTPAQSGQARPIEVCNIGRRSPVTHAALLADAKRRGSFYYYDTVAASGSDLKSRTFRVDAAQEHRIMLATILKHSSLFIANRSYANTNVLPPERDEISARFYEGAAAGTVMIGVSPRTDEFKRQFDWPDAIIEMPFDEPEIGQLLSDLASQPERLQAARRNNIREAAARHDWLHRIERVFDTLGLAPTEKMKARAQRLNQIAQSPSSTIASNVIGLRA